MRETVPEASEAVYPVWRGLGYRHPRAGYFCGVFPARDCVKLAFEFGLLLSDPEGLLREGPTSTRKVRYVEVREASDVRVQPIRALLRQAVRLKAEAPRPARRATRRSPRGR